MIDQFYCYIADADDRHCVISTPFDVHLARVAAHVRYFAIQTFFLSLTFLPLELASGRESLTVRLIEFLP